MSTPAGPRLTVDPRGTKRSLIPAALICLACLLTGAPTQQARAQQTPSTPPPPAANPDTPTRQGRITGQVRDRDTQEPLVGAAVVVVDEGGGLSGGGGVGRGTATDAKGRFSLSLPVGTYNLRTQATGYAPQTRFNVSLTTGNDLTLTFELDPAEGALEEVEVNTNRASVTRVATAITPLSVQRLSAEEIRSNPGGNFDISRVVQVLPGVSGSAGTVGGFRNDLVIRGGGPSENVYYLDGIEISQINHFATQGAAGGPVGILNVSFIEDVKLSSSAFDARYDNALSSVLEFRQREGSRERVQGNVRLSSTELATTLEGPSPVPGQSTFLASVRRSYLQLLFKLIDLPIRPNYWDFQFKHTTQLSKKTRLTVLGVGALDEFGFGVPRNSTPENEYIIRSVPTINQWNYTGGVAVRHLIEGGFVNVALSRTHFNNALDRFEDNRKGDESRRALRSRSDEIEDRLRIEVSRTVAPRLRVQTGVMAQHVGYRNDFFQRLTPATFGSEGQPLRPPFDIRFNSTVNYWRFGAFVQAQQSLLEGGRLTLSGGVRTDVNTLTTQGLNPGQALSPRVAVSYQVADRWWVNGTVGRYARLPFLTALGFRDSVGQLVNRDLRYLLCDHYVSGVEWRPTERLRLTAEGFYKDYRNYPVSRLDGVSLANQGGGFGVIGNEPVTSAGRGRAYGAEFFLQQQFDGRIFAVLSYTLVRSEFSGASGRLISSTWDNRHLISALLGRKFARGWEVGLKYRYAGGAPVTPFDLTASQARYASLGVGVLDIARLNSERLPAFQQFDIRIDKKWNFRKVTLDLFLDVQNALLQRQPAFPNYTFARLPDGSDWATTDGGPLREDGSNAQPLILDNISATAIPSLGFIVEF